MDRSPWAARPDSTSRSSRSRPLGSPLERPAPPRRLGHATGGLALVGALALCLAVVPPAAAQGGFGMPPFGGPVGPTAPGFAPSAAAPPNAEELARMAEAVNAIRTQNGRPPLKVQPQLAMAAQRHADGMAQSRTLSHTGAFGSRPADRMRAAGYETCGGGENVAFGMLQTVDDIARGWYDSPTHREIMLNSQVREMGIGRAQTPDGLVYWALEVGQRPSVVPVVINQEAAATPTGSVTVYVYSQVSDFCMAPPRTITQVTLSNSPTFADAQTFPYSPTLSWTLTPGEGTRTVYARLLDSSGRTLEAQDDILVSSSAPPPNTATNLTPPVQTITTTGPNGMPSQLTLYRTSFTLPSNGSFTAPPCMGSPGGCSSFSGGFPGGPGGMGGMLGGLGGLVGGPFGLGSPLGLPGLGSFGPAGLGGLGGLGPSYGGAGYGPGSYGLGTYGPASYGMGLYNPWGSGGLGGTGYSGYGAPGGGYGSLGSTPLIPGAGVSPSGNCPITGLC